MTVAGLLDFPEMNEIVFGDEQYRITPKNQRDINCG